MIRLLWGLKPWIFAPQTATTALTSWSLGAKKCAAWYGVKMDRCKNKCTNQWSWFFENLTAKIWLQTCISSAKVGVCSQCNVLQIFSMPSHTKKVWTSFFQPRKTNLEGFALKYLTRLGLRIFAWMEWPMTAATVAAKFLGALQSYTLNSMFPQFLWIEHDWTLEISILIIHLKDSASQVPRCWWPNLPPFATLILAWRNLLWWSVRRTGRWWRKAGTTKPGANGPKCRCRWGINGD